VHCNTCVLTPPLTRTLFPPAGHDTGRALSLFILNPLSTSRRHRRSQQHRTSPLHSAIGTAPRTRPPPPFCLAVVRENQKVDRTATMNPVLICLLVMVTFFFLLCDAARTGLAQGRAISPSP